MLAALTPEGLERVNDGPALAPRREYAADIPRDLPVPGFTAPEVPRQPLPPAGTVAPARHEQYAGSAAHQPKVLAGVCPGSHAEIYVARPPRMPVLSTRRLHPIPEISGR